MQKPKALFTLNDFERPLNEKGKKMLLWRHKAFLDKKIIIDACKQPRQEKSEKNSGAGDETYKAQDDIIFISALYHAPAEIFFDVIKEVDDIFDTIAVLQPQPRHYIF